MGLWWGTFVSIWNTALDGSSSTRGISSSRGPVSTSTTFARFVGGRLGDELPSDQRRSRLTLGTAGSPPTGGYERKEQNNLLSKGFRSVVQNFSESEERVPHSFTTLDVGAAAVGTGGGAGR